MFQKKIMLFWNVCKFEQIFIFIIFMLYCINIKIAMFKMFLFLYVDRCWFVHYVFCTAITFMYDISHEFKSPVGQTSKGHFYPCDLVILIVRWSEHIYFLKITFSTWALCSVNYCQSLAKMLISIYLDTCCIKGNRSWRYICFTNTLILINQIF